MRSRICGVVRILLGYWISEVPEILSKPGSICSFIRIQFRPTFDNVRSDGWITQMLPIFHRRHL